MKLYTFKIWILLKHYSIQISSRVQLMTICRFCLRMLYKSLNSIRLTIFKRRRNSFSPLPFFSSIFCKLCKMHPKKSCSNVLRARGSGESQHKNVDGDNFSKKNYAFTNVNSLAGYKIYCRFFRPLEFLLFVMFCVAFFGSSYIHFESSSFSRFCQQRFAMESSMFRNESLKLKLCKLRICGVNELST